MPFHPSTASQREAYRHVVECLQKIRRYSRLPVDGAARTAARHELYSWGETLAVSVDRQLMSDDLRSLSRAVFRDAYERACGELRDAKHTTSETAEVVEQLSQARDDAIISWIES